MSEESKVKRSSVLRRTIKPKQKTFSSCTSLSRLRRVQSLLAKQADGQKAARAAEAVPDALLCVLGIDGRYNEAMAELANYLFFDFYKNNQNDFALYGLAEEVFEDVMLVIHSNRVDFYCNPLIIHHFLPYVAAWKNLHIHCLKEDEYNPDDEDEMEEFKIRSFIAMVEGSSVVGLPYSNMGQQRKKFDQMTIEKWPIVQAFALEGFGGGGFFTMTYQVVDFSASLHNIYQLLDPVGLEVLVTEKLVFLEKQWSNVLSLCDRARSSHNVDLTEDFICEPLRSYFEHGSIGCDVTDSQKNCLDWLPFVLLGKNTSKSNLKQKLKGSKVNGMDQKQEEVPTHMICQSISPRGQLRCRRTYFFKADHAVYPDGFDWLTGDIRESHLNKDIRVLASVYKACVAATAAAIDTFAASFSDIAQIKSATVDVIMKECELLKTPAVISSWLRDNIEIQVDCNDLCSRSDLELGQMTEFVKSVVITVFDIPSLDQPGQNLGSVSYADSFIHSTIQVQFRDGHVENSGMAVAITSLIPSFVTWILDEPGKQNDLRLRSHLMVNERNSSAGELLCLGDAASLGRYDGCSSALLRNGELCIFENVITFIHSSSSCVLPISQLKSICFYDGGAMNAVALVVFTYADQCQDFLPVSLCSGRSNALVCFLLPKTKTYRSFFTKVLPFWKNHDRVKQLVTIWTELPEDLTELHHQVQDEYVITFNKTSVGEATDFKTMKYRIPELENLVSHLMMSCAGEQTISSEHLDAVLGGAVFDQGVFEDNQQMILTVIAGTPGSHKDQLFANVLKEFRFRGDEWRIIRSTADDMIEEFNVAEFQKSLGKAWTEWRDKSINQQTGLKKLRGILLLPGFTDPSDFIQAIQTHPNEDVSKWTTVGAVTVCVDPMDCFMDHVYALPKFLDSCHQGWVNNIVMTNLSCKDDLLSSVQRLLRSANSDVVFLSADKGNLIRTQDLEVVLSDVAFMNSSLLRARYLSCPGWFYGLYESGPSVPEMNQVLLKFSLPLERSKLLSRLNGLKSNLKRYPFQGNIYYVHGRMLFTDSSQMHDVAFATLSGHLHIFSSGKPGSNALHSRLLVIGCRLEEMRLKDWLRECTTEKKEKPLRTRDSLTQAEIRRIHKERHLEELPEGWFYNGNLFVSLDGQRSDIHPNLERFLEEYLERVNREVLQHNATLKNEESQDLFDLTNSSK